MSFKPFGAFAQSIQPQAPLRAAITSAYRRAETECVPPLIEQATLSAAATSRARALARRLVEALRAKSSSGGVEGLIHEYSLSSQEGVALMCLAEALLRIPDDDTRDALIRDKIGGGDWRAHLGHSPSLFVNAATWGLMLTGRLTATSSEHGLSAALTRLIGKGGEPLIRGGVNIAMRLMGEQFVAGQTIEEALEKDRSNEGLGVRHSYDMLGEAAVTAQQAEAYLRSYEHAIHAIGRFSAGRGIYEGSGISIKLSALHPRYSRAQQERVQAELYPRLKSLAVLARGYDIGLNIDAEEADRWEISLDLLERLCFESELEGWNGIGFVVQAYQKRAVFTIDWLIDLARRSKRRIMVRLVKGAYWDGEIKRAQLDGLEDYPVFTRRIHTDVSYLACARRLLAAPDAAFPQFGTHNALTLATLHTMAGENFYAGQYEFQYLHGMGEPLYDEVVGPTKLNRPCRIYTPVGTHETLLAYLVRRLLENGANTSFVNQIANPEVTLEALLGDPVERARAVQPLGAPHPRIALPRDLFGTSRPNSRGLDLSNEQVLSSLAKTLPAIRPLVAAPLLADESCNGTAREIRNPADQRDLVGAVVEATPEQVGRACALAKPWQVTPAERASVLRRAADLMEGRCADLLGPIVREAGKTLGNAVGEVREAVDFLRYYAGCVENFDNETHQPLGVVACISPWNFPLSIFTGQIAGALAAGNAVIAKPAEETPLIAALGIAALHEAGVPRDALQFLPGDGETGKHLVGNEAIAGVVFTGSTEAAQSINRTLARRLGRDGKPLPLIAETGGQNALVADSSALPEQLVLDTLTSAFDSAGQRCSALRVLCLQEDIADRVVPLLEGAMDELGVGNPDRLSVDVGPVISAEAQKRLLDHIARMRTAGHRVHQMALPAETRHGTFVPPTLIEIGAVSDLPGEVFGPVLHVLRYPRERMTDTIKAVNATGFGLTFGVHSRIDETIERAVAASAAGNQYVNRNMIGAVVGVQPFGGHGLSGTGPKAGGPLYVHRLLSKRPSVDVPTGELAGPVGERNTYALRPKGTILCVAFDAACLQAQLDLVKATGNRSTTDATDRGIRAVLFAGSPGDLEALLATMAGRDGPIVPVYVEPYPREFLLDEVSISINTAAAGGNASLMAIG
ncbi:bifunctional proline dehydrogenase/L-glutamate gamma-semialdehyde dehydrogenase PutA [Reyranella sp.]|uniref:bifunctional proline dehydrogenase/L-glutamate gamma-semialdehyde dehydrogenase PutA n=1 Tax=Reyranella sp. TaxID=1929291 RepID=UPI001228753A|nr:bifunctional proline dehydrogenase/L-glutamate gamma-semialdehyde dehydrogenase PutA [Reyranella sp.]TAJ84117.1 MAG: bifunctional proline dehydrogenase/L-glutamate gamma-semialdehyde dehydrogenase PutA [Reyranella sp.]